MRSLDGDAASGFDHCDFIGFKRPHQYNGLRASQRIQRDLGIAGSAHRATCGGPSHMPRHGLPAVGLLEGQEASELGQGGQSDQALD